MAGVGFVLIVVVLQIVVSAYGAWRLAAGGLGRALLPVLALPAAFVLLAVALMLEAGGFSEGFARATPIFAAVLIVLMVIGSIAAVAAFRCRR